MDSNHLRLRRCIKNLIILMPLNLVMVLFNNCSGFEFAIQSESSPGQSDQASNGGPKQPLPSKGFVEAAAACESMPLRQSGKTYYICDCQGGAEPGCVAGNDSNLGTSPSAPWQSLLKAKGTFNDLAQMKAGDTIAFCRGGSWDANGLTTAVWSNSNCQADPVDLKNPNSAVTCDIRDYAPVWSQKKDRPLFTLTKTAAVSFFNFGSLYNDDQGIRILNLDLRANGVGPAKDDTTYNRWAIFTYSSGSTPHLRQNFFICNNNFDGWDITFHTPGLDSSLISGNRISNSSVMGLLGSGNDLMIDSNYWFNNGSSNMFDHTIYLGNHGASESRNVTISNNDIYAGTALAGSAGQCQDDSKPCCQGVVVVVHGKYDGLHIDANLIDGQTNSGGGCWGIAADHGGYPDAVYFRHLTVTRNKILSSGNSGIAVSQSPGAVVENNVVVANQAGYGINLPFRAQRPGDDVQDAVVIRHNTIYFPSSANNSTGIIVGTEGSGHKVFSNVTAFNGSISSTCFAFNLSLVAYSAIDNNLCHGFKNWEKTHSSLLGWQTSSGFDSQSFSGDPLFLDAPGDFIPALGSVLVGNANPASPAIHDFTGKLRRSGSPSDIGAFER
jgi:hypothetical protein